MTTRTELHQLVDELPEQELAWVAEYIKRLRSSDSGLPRVLREAPWDDEPDDPGEEEGNAEAWADLRAGRVLTNEELRRELGW